MAQSNPLVAPAPPQGAQAHEGFRTRVATKALAYARFLSKHVQSTRAVRVRSKLVILGMALSLKLASLSAALKILFMLAIVEFVLRNRGTAVAVERTAAPAHPAPLLKSFHGIAHIMPVDQDEN